MSRVFCPTETALLLLAVRAGDPPILRAPFGLGLALTPRPLTPIDAELRELVEQRLGPVARQTLAIEPDYTDRVPLRSDLAAENPEASATLYLATCDLPAGKADAAWPSFPDLLRGMPPDRSRLPYLRAFQVLSGGLHLNTKAIEASELAKYFREP